MNPSDITFESIVTFSDFSALKGANETGASVISFKTDPSKLRDMSVVGKRVVHERGKLCSWHFFHLESRSGEDVCRVFLCLKVVDNKIAARIYESPDWFENGSRQDLDDAGVASHIFDMTEDAEGPSDGTFKKEVVLDLGTYHKKMQTLYGEVDEITGENNGDRFFCSVTEYYTNVGDAKNEMVIIETGGFDEGGEPLPEGGFIELLVGREINVKSDIKII